LFQHYRSYVRRFGHDGTRTIPPANASALALIFKRVGSIFG
jgi:hypothetical protein